MSTVSEFSSSEGNLNFDANLRIFSGISTEILAIIYSEDTAVADFAAKIIQVSVYYTKLGNIIILLAVG